VRREALVEGSSGRMAWYGMAWYGMTVWYGVVCYGMLWHRMGHASHLVEGVGARAEAHFLGGGAARVRAHTRRIEAVQRRQSAQRAQRAVGELRQPRLVRQRAESGKFELDRAHLGERDGGAAA
jgi:hypothetical protein